MTFNYYELKSILVQSLSEFTGWNKDAVEQMIVNPMEAIDMPEIGNAAGIEGIPFLRYFADDVYIYLTNDYRMMRLMFIFGDRCFDVEAARSYIEKYGMCKYGKVFTVVNEINNDDDALMMEADFCAAGRERAVEMLSFLFSIFEKPDFIKVARPMLHCFDMCAVDTAI